MTKKYLNPEIGQIVICSGFSSFTTVGNSGIEVYYFNRPEIIGLWIGPEHVYVFQERKTFFIFKSLIKKII